jgi:predicted protein tyrosine phosphatase
MNRSDLDLIYTTSRAGAEAFTWPNPFAVISITDPGSQAIRLTQRNLVARLHLQFWDLPSRPDDDRPVFDSEMAQNALDFVQRGCAGVKMLMIHCEAGISRSTGLANALGRIFGVEVRHENREFVDPNILVMRVVRENAPSRLNRKRVV